MSSLRILATAAGLALVAGCTDAVSPTQSGDLETVPPVSAASGNSGPSASGHINFTIGDGLQTFSFHARTNKNGTSGSFEVKSRGQDLQLHGDVTCLNVDGNEAIVVGPVTNSKMPEGLEGLELLWAVRDNGEGAGAADEWTDIFPAFLIFDFYNVADCTELVPGDVLTDIANLDYGGVLPLNEAGNVQVKP